MKNDDEENRDVFIKFRVTKAEAEWLEEKYQNSQCKSKSDFIRRMILDGVIVLINEETDMKIQNLLHNIANNINQIAKRANATGSIYAQDIAEIQEGVERIWQQQKSFQSNILKYRQSNILPIPQKPTTGD